MWNLKPFNIYTLCSQEKKLFFQHGFEALSYIYSILTRKKIMFFQCRIWNPLVSILYVPKKIIIFLIWDLKPFRIYTLCSQEKKYVFSMWNKKLFGLNTST